MSQKTSAALVVALLLTLTVRIGEAADNDSTGHEELVIRSLALGQSLTSELGDGFKNSVQTFCEEPDIKDLALPNGLDALAATECFDLGGPVGPVEHTELFFGNNRTLTGVGFWFSWGAGVPAQPRFIVRIYQTGPDGCPAGNPIFVASCDVVNIGPGSGSPTDPIEYFCNFSDNGVADFYKEGGVEYSISIVNDNCPGEGSGAYLATGTGDGVFGCILAPGIGIPVWTPKEDVGITFDNAMYLCNEPLGSDVNGGIVASASKVVLYQNTPNPFNPRTVLGFYIPTISMVDLSIFDVVGRRIRTLVSGRLDAGLHSATWDGTDAKGVPMSSGIFVGRLTTQGYTGTQKLILLK